MLYPLFVAARLIFLLIKKDRRWLEAKRNYDINISSIEPLVESIPQLFIMYYIIINNFSGDTIDFDIIFKLSFASTILSAAYALTSQLKLGPCQIMPRDKFGLPFVIIFFSNVFGLLGKGLLLGVLAVYMK